MPCYFLKIDQGEPDFSSYLKDPHLLKEDSWGVFRSPNGSAAIIYDGKGVILVADKSVLNSKGLKVFKPFEDRILWNVVRPPRKRQSKWSLVFAANRETREAVTRSINIKSDWVIISFIESDFLLKNEIPVIAHGLSFRKGERISLSDGRTLLVEGVS